MSCKTVFSEYGISVGVCVTEIERMWHCRVGYGNIWFFFSEYIIPISKVILFHIYLSNSEISSTTYYRNQRNLLAVSLTYK